jgi:hypothetical protein
MFRSDREASLHESRSGSFRRPSSLTGPPSGEVGSANCCGGSGPSGWLAAPVRRIVQSICFLEFLWLFFVTCWPYSATPSRSWNGWIPAEFDFDSNSVLLVSEEGTDSDAAFVIGQRVFLRDDSAGLTGDPLTAPFEIILAPDGELRLERTSNIQHPTSNIQHPTSNIQHPTSNIQHPTSNIQHPTLNIEGDVRDVRSSMLNVRRSKNCR